MMEWLHQLKELHSTEGIQKIVAWGGLPILTAIVFAETGLLLGFFLPGDSLLIAAGVFSNPHSDFHALNVVSVNIALVLAAVIGNQLGYFLGTRVSDKIWERPDGRLYKRKHMKEAHDFYVKHGALAIIGTRFVPIMRTFVPFAAGVAKMPPLSFFIWNVVGGVLWVTGLLWAGYWLGGTTWAKRLDQVLVVVVLVSFLPMVIGAAMRWWKGRSSQGANS
ncbi:DedA family protein [soil metagenome]